MKQFEAFFQKGYDFYERYFEDGESKISKIPLQSETFIESPIGDHTFILDKSIKLLRVLKRNAKGLKTYGSNNIGLEWIRQKYWSFEKSNYNLKPRVWSIDIETTAHGSVNTKECPERIVSIQVYDNYLNTNFIFALEDFDINKHTTESGNYVFDKVYDFKIKFLKLNEEVQLLKAYFQLVKALKPLIVMAHNGEAFDFAYLWKKTKKYDLQEGFSPFGESTYNEEERQDGRTLYKIQAPGVFYMDSIDLYKKFAEDSRVSSSYSLDYLCQVNLGETKVNHDCFRTFDGFRTGTGYIKPPECPDKSSTLEYLLYNAKNEDEIISISKEWFMHYSIIDSYLLHRLMGKVRIVDVMMGIASMMGCQVGQTLGVISPWSIYIRNFGLTRKQVMPDREEIPDYSEFKGGFVKDPQAGKYGWTFSVDVTSMYPSQIMAFNLSADTFVPYHKVPEDLRKVSEGLGLNEDEEYHLKEYKKHPEKYKKYSDLLKKYNLCGSLVNGFFRRDEKGILPTLVEHVFNARKADKKVMLEYQRKYETSKDPKDKDLAEQYDILQLTKKILICAIFGANGNPHFILFNDKIAASITGNSRFYVNLFSQNVDDYLKELSGSNLSVVYNDTDSAYFKIPSCLVDKALDKNTQTDKISDWIESDIQPVINKSSEELGDLFNALDSSRISAKREAISDASVFVAKKRYFMRVLDSEFVRYTEPHLKTMGIDIVRSTTPKFSQKHLTDSINLILDSDEETLRSWLSNVRDEFMKQPLMDLAKTSSISKTNYNLKTDKAIPINSRAFLVTNQFIKEQKLDSQFQYLEPGEKLKMLYLKLPNPVNQNIFAFNDERFAQLFKPYIDWDTNFKKFFLQPLKLMVEPIGWYLDKQTESLEIW